MAQRTRGRSTKPDAPADPQPELLSPSISTQVGEETFTYYSNFAEVAFIPQDFTIMFGRLPVKLPPEKIEEARAGNLSLTCDVQIIVPTTMIDGLIRALNTQKALYEQRFGPIHEPGGRRDAESGN